VGISTEMLENGTHVGHLQTPAKLNAKESHAHVDELEKIQSFSFIGIHSYWESSFTDRRSRGKGNRFPQ
jgi:hypothetical protein